LSQLYLSWLGAQTTSSLLYIPRTTIIWPCWTLIKLPDEFCRWRWFNLIFLCVWTVDEKRLTVHRIFQFFPIRFQPMAWDWWSPLPVSTWWQLLNRLCSTWFRSLLFPFSCWAFVDESFRSSGTEMDRYEYFSRQILMWWKYLTCFFSFFFQQVVENTRLTDSSNLECAQPKVDPAKESLSERSSTTKDRDALMD
jgi:hypothetical protein